MHIEEDIIKLKKEIKEKMFDHANSTYNRGKKEALGFLFGNYFEKEVVIDDLVIPQQIATKISVSETENDIEIIKKIKDFDLKSIKKVHVGWYHSHPGMGCFLSGIDEETQKYWQLINERMVAVVLDNVSGEIEAFRVKIQGSIRAQYKLKLEIIH